MQFQCIQVLSDSNKDVDAWYNQMKAWITLYQITDEKEIFNNCKFKVIGKSIHCLNALVTKDVDNNIVYPSLEEIRDALLKFHDLYMDPEDIIDKLKNMAISTRGNIKEFNKEYKELYNKLDEDDRRCISVSDYLKSIFNKKEAWKGVKLAGKRISLAKAFSTAELIDEVENECGKRTSNSNGNSSYNQKFNSHNNKIFNNKSVTHESRDNNFKNNNLNNDGNKGKYKVQMCYFCNEEGHKKYNCPKFNHFEYLKY